MNSLQFYTELSSLQMLRSLEHHRYFEPCLHPVSKIPETNFNSVKELLAGSFCKNLIAELSSSDDETDRYLCGKLRHRRQLLKHKDVELIQGILIRKLRCRYEYIQAHGIATLFFNHNEENYARRTSLEEYLFAARSRTRMMGTKTHAWTDTSEQACGTTSTTAIDGQKIVNEVMQLSTERGLQSSSVHLSSYHTNSDTNKGGCCLQYPSENGAEYSVCYSWTDNPNQLIKVLAHELGHAFVGQQYENLDVRFATEISELWHECAADAFSMHICTSLSRQYPLLTPCVEDQHLQRSLLAIRLLEEIRAVMLYSAEPVTSEWYFHPERFGYFIQEPFRLYVSRKLYDLISRSSVEEYKIFIQDLIGPKLDSFLAQLWEEFVDIKKEMSQTRINLGPEVYVPA